MFPSQVSYNDSVVSNYFLSGLHINMPLCYEEYKRSGRSFFQRAYNLIREITWIKYQTMQQSGERPSWIKKYESQLLLRYYVAEWP